MKKVVSLKLAKLSVSKKIEKARFIVTSMTGNTNFPTPGPSLATITTNANNLETAHITAMGGGVDDTANMHAKEQFLDLSLKSLAAYVEGIANANPANAEAIILSSGMEIKTQAIHTARDFQVETTGNPGEVKLITKFVNRATILWQMTTDPNNQSSWQTIKQATQAKCLVTGLGSGTRYYFRVAVIDKDGQHPWSNVLNTIVL